MPIRATAGTIRCVWSANVALESHPAYGSIAFRVPTLAFKTPDTDGMRPSGLEYQRGVGTPIAMDGCTDAMDRIISDEFRLYVPVF